MATLEHYIGLMSGTSQDGINAVLMAFSADSHKILGQAFVPYQDALRSRLLALHLPHAEEMHEAAVVGNELASLYARAVENVLEGRGVPREDVAAIGCHGQTIRHRPDAGYTIQIGNGALLAELTGITVVNDFRGRDIAAAGEGAPLVPAFHQAAFANSDVHRVIVNIGGIANLTDLAIRRETRGFDTGPGNMLMDAWIQRQQAKPFDRSGAWAQSGRVDDTLLDKLLAHEFFERPPPKSTGRDTFNLGWVTRHLRGTEKDEDVQATLLALTATTIARSIGSHCGDVEEIYVCGGGAHNTALIAGLRAALPARHIGLTDELGIGADWVEACAFAWLARQALHLIPGNLPAVTGARGPRVLGAIYPR
jgi:anhydro-N-acetylmuramic acid kinase